MITTTTAEKKMPRRGSKGRRLSFVSGFTDQLIDLYLRYPECRWRGKNIQELEMVQKYIGGHEIEHLAEDYGLSYFRVRSILTLARKAIVRDLFFAMTEIKKENESLRHRTAGLKAENFRLRKGIIAKKKITAPPDIALEDLDLSVRLYNCLKAGKINTLLELLDTKESTLWSIRGFGKHCMTELEDTISKYRSDETKKPLK